VSQLPPPLRTGRQQSQADEYDDGPFTFRPATRDRVKARMSIQGVAGCGKTWTALNVAHGLNGGERFAVIDTERESASLYLGVNGIQFDTCSMHRYDPRDLVKALAAAAKHGYGTVVVDSLSHFWKGTDGTLDQVEKAKAKYGGNSFAGWKDGTPIQNEMIDALLSYPGHIIATMRSHTEWVDIQNRMRFLKSRCPTFHQQVIEKPDGVRDIAKPFLDWLNDGEEAADPSTYVDDALAETATAESLLALYREVEGRGLLGAPMLTPDGKATSLGAYIRERGTALKNAPQ
jgi:hypothetical protein